MRLQTTFQYYQDGSAELLDNYLDKLNEYSLTFEDKYKDNIEYSTEDIAINIIEKNINDAMYEPDEDRDHGAQVQSDDVDAQIDDLFYRS